MSINFERARLAPAAVFDSPQSVLRCAELSREEKIDLLLRWAYDAAELAVASEEGMPGGELDSQVQILAALQSLQHSVDLERTGPTKQHGLPLV